MDFLLSVPVASYFLTPTSFSSSINILFFYMTWTTLVLSHPPLVVHLVGVFAIRLLFGLIPGLVSLLLDGALPSVFEHIKYGGRSAIPPTDWPTFFKIIALTVVNVALMLALEGLSSTAYMAAFGHPEFVTRSTLPLPWYVAKHVAALFATREVLLFYIHRYVLHGEADNAVVNYVSDRHLGYAHGRPGAPYILQYYVDHPVPFLLHRFLPVYLPALALRPHLLTYFLFVMLCTLEDTFSMSSYTIVPGFIMGGMTRRQAIHYASGGDANYGALGLLDWAHGTGQGTNVLDDARAEADAHHLKERSAAKASSVVSAIQNGVESLQNGDSEEAPRRTGRKRAPTKKKTN